MAGEGGTKTKRAECRGPKAECRPGRVGPGRPVRRHLCPARRFPSSRRPHPFSPRPPARAARSLSSGSAGSQGQSPCISKGRFPPSSTLTHQRTKPHQRTKRRGPAKRHARRPRTRPSTHADAGRGSPPLPAPFPPIPAGAEANVSEWCSESRAWSAALRDHFQAKRLGGVEGAEPLHS